MSPLLLPLILLCLCRTARTDAAPESVEVTPMSPLLTEKYFTNAELVSTNPLANAAKSCTVQEAYMRNFTSSAQCGSISRMFSVGKSVEGIDLWVLEIALNPGKEEAKPNFKYVANMHGDETSGRQLLLKLAEWLCLNRKTDPKAAEIVNGMHLYLMPTMNPDGYALEKRRNKVDLNRNFPDQYHVDGNYLLAQGTEEPETRAVMDWITSGFFVGSGNLHEGAVVANYPWDADETGKERYAASPDDETFIYLASLYANAHLTMHDSKEFDGGITNGNAWYPVYGGMQDFNYIMGNCMELTLELSEDKHPHPSQLEVLWEQNKDAFLDFAITAALRSFRGFVYGPDKVPLAATISVEGIDKDYVTRPKLGDFYRPLIPGKHNVTIQAVGYHTLVIDVEVPENKTSEMHRYELQSMDDNVQLRIIHAQSDELTQATSFQMPTLMMGLLLTAFVALGVHRVRRASMSRPLRSK